MLNRRAFLTTLTAATAATASSRFGIAANRDGALAEPAFRPLPLGSITPGGWLARQLRIQADGLTGHLDEFWPDVSQSQWFGGKAEGWERAPYWLDGAIPLAWTLDDQKLKGRLLRHVAHIVEHQRPDGWYAPYPADANAKSYDIWSILLANKVLVQYHEATRDEKVLDAVLRNLKAVLQSLERTPLFKWGKFRWFEGLIPVYYAYEATGEDWLLTLGKKLHEQGFDYRAFYAGEDIKKPTQREKWTYEKHVVNAAMAIKAYALAWRLTRSEADRGHAAEMLGVLDEYHGQVTGMFSGDECLSGKSPLQGTELCSVVELMYSLEQVLSLTGDPSYGDRLERIAFNALPAAFKPDMWAHQYDQQVNQVQCTINPQHRFSTNGPDSNLYGLEPHFGCCTANMHQGWPKFAAHLWMRTPDNGIAAMAYAPCSVQFMSAGQPVSVTVATDYPFRDTVQITVSAGRTARFPLLLRIPAWAKGATLGLGGGALQSLKPGTFHRELREWNGTTEIALKLPMRAVVSRRHRDAIAIERGPLVYALRMGEAWKQVNADKPHRELPHGDFEVRPTTPWNYALMVDESDPSTNVAFTERPIGAVPFSPEGAGVVAHAKGRKLPEWRLEGGWAGETPPSPQKSAEPIEEVSLIPYGCTNIRITEFPRLEA